MFSIIGHPKSNSKIAAFDLDHTLIRPKSGNKFPKDIHDWTIIDGVKEVLNKYSNNGFKIIIFTNLMNCNVPEFTIKINAIEKELKVPLQVFISTDYGYYRKPSIGLWTLLKQNNDGIEIDKSLSFYVGDAYSKEHSFSDSDLKFALNIGIKFYKDIKMKDEVFERPEHPLDKCTNGTVVIEPYPKQEMIILVGPPAASKSTFSSKFKDYVIVNQDILGTKTKCLTLSKKSIKEGKSVVIDRKNEYIKDRLEFIKLAKDVNILVRIVWFNISKEVSEHLATYREIITGKHVPKIVFNKYYSKEKGLLPPTKEECDEIIETLFQIDEDLITNRELFYSYLV